MQNIDHFLSLAAEARACEVRVRTNYLKHISRLTEENHSFRNFDPDVAHGNSLFRLPDQFLGMVIAAATASNLKRLGYRGARSENGSLSPLMTVVLNKVQDHFGPAAVDEIKAEDGSGLGTRGILHKPEVIDFFVRELDSLIVKLLGTYGNQLPIKAV